MRKESLYAALAQLLRIPRTPRLLTVTKQLQFSYLESYVSASIYIYTNDMTANVCYKLCSRDTHLGRLVLEVEIKIVTSSIYTRPLPHPDLDSRDSVDAQGVEK